MTAIFVDGDACPVWEEIYRVAVRLALDVFVASNGSRPIRPPDTPNVRMALSVILRTRLTTGSRSIFQRSTYASPPIFRSHRAVSRKVRASSLRHYRRNGAIRQRIDEGRLPT